MVTTTDRAEAITVIGAGRVGRSIAAAAGRAGLAVELRNRTEGLEGLAGATVLLCVPDQEIAPLAGRIGGRPGLPRLLGHTSGATRLDALAGGSSHGSFSLHPLQTVPDGETDLGGCPAAVSGSDPRALDLAAGLAGALGMEPFPVSEADRAIYHAAASIASNFLVTLEETAAGLLGEIAVEDPRTVLAPLVGRSLQNWIERGGAALTGPIARGDAATVELHRRALAERRPDLSDFYEALALRTSALAGESR
jgi:predicted short-subunit dehydrogenase-like oxidoreductase (DUF2520 family)